MAFVVRVTGPEFISEESTRAFLRIEESVRQYSGHSRESIYLIRRPLSLAEDHFVLVWSRGAALVGLYPFGGTIRGKKHGAWESETDLPVSLRATSKSRAENLVETFENPYESLARSRRELVGLLRRSAVEHEPVEAASANAEIAQDRGSLREERPTAGFDDRSVSIPIVALFTGPVSEILFDEPIVHDRSFGEDAAFSTMSVEYAVSRTIVHMPNLLRAASSMMQDASTTMRASLGSSGPTLHASVIYPSSDLEAIAEVLERSARSHVASDGRKDGSRGRTVGTQLAPPNGQARRFHPSLKWMVPLVIVVIIIAFFGIRSLLTPGLVRQPDSVTAVRKASHPLSEMIIELPVEVQLYVSPNMYQTRLELDRALARGEGQRYLPDKEQILVMDSIAFAKGVYGYFKVDNAWRKGKLIETFQPLDTIRIVKFLDPLP